jgi:hypothetical protein
VTPSPCAPYVSALKPGPRRTILLTTSGRDNNAITSFTTGPSASTRTRLHPGSIPPRDQRRVGAWQSISSARLHGVARHRPVVVRPAGTARTFTAADDQRQARRFVAREEHSHRSGLELRCTSLHTASYSCQNHRHSHSEPTRRPMRLNIPSTNGQGPSNTASPPPAGKSNCTTCL